MFKNIGSRIVNLKNVSNINIIEYQKRIAYNLNYSIKMDNGSLVDKYISDYVYQDCPTNEEFQTVLSYLAKDEYIIKNFIGYKDYDVKNDIFRYGYININEISTIKFSEKKKRIIINLSHPVSFVDNNGVPNITSEFVFINFKTQDEYNAAIQEFKNLK
jgi:hypothetical protein